MEPKKKRTILHVDMDAYFASVEQKANPYLRGKPIMVCGDPDGRSVVTTSSYEARAWGVKTGMMLWEAKKVCPQGILLPCDPDKYVEVSLNLLNIYKEFTPVIEVFSIDESFLDITGTERLFGTPLQLAEKLKKRIREEIGLTCSVGIASTKLLAKLASDIRKPDGLFWLKDEEVLHFLEDLPISEICGIGPKLTLYLNKLGIRTCGGLSRYPVELLEDRFGKIGTYLHRMALGLDEGPVLLTESGAKEDEEKVKSVGHSITLPKDTHNREVAKNYLLSLSEQVARRLRRKHYKGKTVSLVIRFPDFSHFSQQKTIKEFIDDAREIYQTALSLLEQVSVEASGVRLVGVSVSNLIKGIGQLSLFRKEWREQMLLEAMDEVNDRYGEFTLTWGRLLDKVKRTNILSPAWRPDKHVRKFRKEYIDDHSEPEGNSRQRQDFIDQMKNSVCTRMVPTEQ
ncbi:MAG TPA: DNA polymerase IV [Terriglobales bacterium]|nr:DNA polymerase IV [Terriglobales bacterium]